MKLLKKLLPFATIASVATIGMAAAVSCSTPTPTPTPEKEYSIKIGQCENVDVDATKFKLNQPVVITYTITGGITFKLDKTLSIVTIGTETIAVEQLLTDDKESAIIIPADKVNSSSIEVKLIARDTQTDKAMTWNVHDGEGAIIVPDDGWADLPERASSEKHFQNIATYEYLTEVSTRKEILAGDLAYSYYKDYTKHATERDYPKYGQIKTIIGDIDPDDSRFNFSIECTPASGQTAYMKLDVKDMQFILIYCHQGTSSEWYYTLDPLAYWLMPSSSDKSAALTYLQNDHKWEVTYTTDSQTPGTPINSESSDTILSNFLDNIRTLGLSFWTHYCENMTPA